MISDLWHALPWLGRIVLIALGIDILMLAAWVVLA